MCIYRNCSPSTPHVTQKLAFGWRHRTCECGLNESAVQDHKHNNIRRLLSTIKGIDEVDIPAAGDAFQGLPNRIGTHAIDAMVTRNAFAVPDGDVVQRKNRVRDVGSCVCNEMGISGDLRTFAQAYLRGKGREDQDNGMT